MSGDSSTASPTGGFLGGLCCMVWSRYLGTGFECNHQTVTWQFTGRGGSNSSGIFRLFCWMFWEFPPYKGEDFFDEVDHFQRFKDCLIQLWNYDANLEWYIDFVLKRLRLEKRRVKKPARWFKPWPFYPRSLEVTNNLWNGLFFPSQKDHCLNHLVFELLLGKSCGFHLPKTVSFCTPSPPRKFLSISVLDM